MKKRFLQLCFEHGKAADGAIFCAFSAADAFFVINGCKEVFDFDCFCGAVFLAFHAADTAVLAFFANDSALFMVGAGNDSFFCFRNERNKMVGAFCDAKSAACTFSGVNFCNSVYDADSIVGTNGCAVAAAKAAIEACAFAAIEHFCGSAGIESLINFFLNLLIAVTAAMNESGDGFCGFSFNAEERAESIGGCFTAGTAKICGGSGDFSKSFCISVASGKTACAAVCAGKAIASFSFDGVYFYAHEYIGKDEKNRTCKTDSGNNESCV